ncbi:MAG: trimeric intracellular cation channel family protein [Gammaproteobacteria bacterium]|nr:trimeric intracellular cation channel family protein [Gammaproteobacteria bacterium]
MSLTLVSVLDYAGVATFAASGALVAAEKRQDVVTFLFFGAITGVGGGTLRDLLIGAPVFWVRDPGYSLVCLLMAVFVWLTHGRGLPRRALLWLDAVGLAVYAVVGAAKAHTLGLPSPVCVVMGVLTATFGGVVRDALGGVPSVLLNREVYISAAIAGSMAYLLAVALGAPSLWATGLGIAVGFGVRAGAILAGWHLPSFSPARTSDSDG